jgi:hypothetical protein
MGNVSINVPEAGETGETLTRAELRTPGNRSPFVL